MLKQPVDCHYELFVDGSPGPKKGPGWAGWGVVLMATDTPIYEACGVACERLSTNAIELEALIQGLAYLLRLSMPCVVPVWTDSQYVAETVARLPALWRDDFMDAKGRPIQNRERILLIYDLLYNMDLGEGCIIRKTKGHEGIAGNEKADELSKLAAYRGEIWYRDNRTIIDNDTTDTDD